MSRVNIVTFVPLQNADAVRVAIGEAGAGAVGEYSYCSYSVVGTGRFLPSEGAKPHIGTRGILESVPEERIEVECDRALAKEVIAGIRRAHPYEEVVVHMYPLLDEVDL